MKDFKEFITEAKLSSKNNLANFEKKLEQEKQEKYKEMLSDLLEKEMKRAFDVKSFSEESGKIFPAGYFDMHWKATMKDGTTVTIQLTKMGESLLYKINGETPNAPSSSTVKAMISSISSNM